MLDEIIIHHSWVIYLFIALLSLAVGSLLNVVIYRMPIMLESEFLQYYEELKGITSEKKQRINLFVPRSFCPICNATVKAWQNIPVFSYLFLHGRCYQCKSPISVRYPLVELFTMLLSVYATWHFGITMQLPFVFIAIWILIALFFIDLEHQILPDSLTLSLLWIGLIANTGNLFTPLTQSVLSAAAAYVGLWLLIKLFYLCTGKVGMGHGDFKLLAALGAWFGWLFLPLILLLSSITGTLIGLIYLRLEKKTIDTSIPFGPFLCISGLITLFWGPSIVTWYLHLWL